MKRALTLATGLAVGYVAGTRAGHDKYEQMKQKVHEVSRQPAVVDMRETLQERAATASKAVSEKVTEKVTEATSGLTKKLHTSSHDDKHDKGDTGDDNASASAPPAPGEYPAAPNGVITGGGAV